VRSFRHPFRLVTVALLAGVVVGAAVAAEPQPVKLNAADQAAAKAVTLKAGDLGPGWKGGPQKPDLKRDDMARCGIEYRDLVLTGAAESQFTAPGIFVASYSDVLQTKRMVQLDWRRAVTSGKLVTCMRTTLADDDRATFVSFKRLSFTRVAPMTARYRLVQDYTASGRTARVLMDMIFLGRGRNEVTLVVSVPYSERAAVAAAELKLARLLASRMRA
jgi:hypothetical protein